MGSGLDEPFDISEPTRLAVEGVRLLVQRRDPDRAAQGCFTHRCLCRYSEDYRAPFPESIPLTSLYSKGDGVEHPRKQQESPMCFTPAAAAPDRPRSGRRC